MAQMRSVLVLAAFAVAAYGRRAQVVIASERPSLHPASSQSLAALFFALQPSIGRRSHQSWDSLQPDQRRISAASGPEMQAETKLEVRQLPKSKIALDIDVPKELESKIHMKVLKELTKKTTIPGFPAGKCPPHVAVNFIGLKKVKTYTVQEIVDMSLKNTGVEQQIQVIGEARLPETMEKLVERYKIGDGISYTLEVDVMPNVVVNSSLYKGLSVDVKKEPFNQEAYDQSMLKLRQRYEVAESLGEGVAAELGHQVIINMNGFFLNADGTKGDPLPNVAAGDALPMKLEEGKFMPGLVEGTVGIKIGETRQVKTQLPNAKREGALTTAMQGADVIFDVECLDVQSLSLPEVDDDFANKVKPGMTLKELEEKLMEGTQQEAEEKQNDAARRAFEKELVGTLPDDLEMPETLINDVTKEQFAEMISMEQDKGKTEEQLKALMSEENYNNFMKMMLPRTVNRLKADLAIKAIARDEGLEVTRDEVDDELMMLRKQAMQMKQQFREKDARPRVEQHMQRTKVLDFLRSFGSVTLIEDDASDENIVEQELGTPEELAARVTDSD